MGDEEFSGGVDVGDGGGRSEFGDGIEGLVAFLFFFLGLVDRFERIDVVDLILLEEFGELVGGADAASF